MIAKLISLNEKMSAFYKGFCKNKNIYWFSISKIDKIYHIYFNAVEILSSSFDKYITQYN